MMRIIRLSAALSVVLLVASCATRSGRPEGPTVPDGASSTVLPPPVNPSGSDLPPAMRPNEASPDARVVDLRPARWSRVEAGAGRDIVVHYTISGRGDCSALGRLDITETDSTVTVTVRLGRQPGADCSGPQPNLAAEMRATATLARPLGGRQVHDGAMP